MAENVFYEGSDFLVQVRDALSEKDRLTDRAGELKGILKRQEKDIATEEKSIRDEVNSTVKKRRGELEDEYDKQISAIRSKKKKAASEKDKKVDAAKASRIKEETWDHVEDSKEAEKELKKLFRKEKVPGFARSKLFYIMFMPGNPLQILMMIVCYAILFAGIPTVITLLIRNFLLKDASEGTRTTVCILVPALLIILFMVIIFLIYVKVKARHIDTLRLGRRYRNAVAKNDQRICEIKRSVEKDTDESQYDVDELNQKLEEISDEEERIRDQKNDALKTFDEETAENLKSEIEAGRLPKLEEMKRQKAAAEAELEQTEKALQEKSLEISRDYASHLGEDMMRVDRLEDLINIINAGQASNVSEAIAYYKNPNKGNA